MDETKKPRGRPKLVGASKTTPRLFRLTDAQHAQVKAFVKALKSRKD